MAPSRKKRKTSGEGSEEQIASNVDSSQVGQEGVKAIDETADPSAETKSAGTGDPTQVSSPTTRSGWTWRSKATPVAQVARESISVAQGSTSESSASKRPPNSVSKSVRGSRKSIPLAAEATKVHATSDVSRPSFSADEKSKGGGEKKSEPSNELVVEEAKLPPDPIVDGAKAAAAAGRQSWFGWWSRPDGYASDSDGPKSKKQKLDQNEEMASNTPLPGTPVDEPMNLGLKNAQDFSGVGVAPPLDQQQLQQEQPASSQRASRGWFGLWSSVQNEQASAKQKKEDVPSQEPPTITVSANPSKVEEAATNAGNASSTAEPKTETTERPKPSGWAFWSSDKSKDPAPTPGGTQKQIGELAVADTPSQSNPEAAQFNEQREEQKPLPKQGTKRSSSLLRPKRGRPERPKDSSAESSPAAPTPVEPSPTPSQVPTPSQTPPPSRDASEPPKKGKATQSRPNQILPTFRDCYPMAPNPGYVERLSQYLASSLHLPGSQATTVPQHVSISHSRPKIRKAVGLGVHGFFPGVILQKVLGQPTGTSIRFANYASSSISNWCAEHQPEIKDVQIEKVALEGEGYIADRVATLWKLLLNWLSHLRAADFILVACHSQGVPVAIMLVAKLIQLGALSSNVRIGVCAMAGINLGPFLEYKSRFFGGTALELFEFSDFESNVSKSYASSLDICLRHGVRVTFVGSIDDQLVSLESALHTPLSHPYVARAVFIDGRLHAPNFLTHLVVFALKLRNLGVSDHGLIRELSAPLAGSLVGGEGHSRVYDDPAVYRLATEFALESSDMLPDVFDTVQPEKTNRTSTEISSAAALASSVRSTQALSGISPIVAPYESLANGANGNNPYLLPFALRGVLEEEIIKRNPRLRQECEMLVKEFEDWRPTSKVLRDVRFRLEGVRSMH